jgi:sarcosine oxidase
MAEHPVVVVGLGAMGSSACAHLASRGAPVIGLDRFSPPHERGSTHGGSRVIRRAYFEHPDYVPLLQRAVRGWDDLEASTGLGCMHRVGVLLIGAAESEILMGSRRSADRYDIPVRHLDPGQLSAAYPQFHLPEGTQGLLEQDAGFVVPENGVRACLEIARRHGAELRYDTQVVSVEADDRKGIVRLANSDIRASRIVVTAGAWTEHLLPSLQSRVRLVPQLKHIVWFHPRDTAACSSDAMPAWVIDDGGASGDGLYYGVPTWTGQVGPSGVKVGFHGPGAPVDPDDEGRGPDPAVVERFRRDMGRYLPDVLDGPAAAATCLYTMSPDRHFVIDALPGAEAVIFAGGFSGHGYKFAPVVGELLADLTLLGGSDIQADFLRLDRFGPSREGEV